ncbi:Hsp20/alpha crystallin family protein [Allopusillimonas soli]|uniref:Hsp20/alpha crystallin family protein n=1 Tax=Allopusillimonas soli TaxID=659016 RepID=A0A853FAT1_9BURK|nr:Hsp20/alpha crystallin family protein [Allopusillimonas soli]NYT37835.1 Hsp20/alpha crystallin family protein [Allopusillimonas soli]TEA74071.1 Hsp20/alpha crystallin family protein [Allopusillimonas soli]
MYRSPFSRNLFAELDRMQRDMQQALGLAPTIRGSTWGGFPAMNMGHTPDAVLVYVFVPGVNADEIDAHIEKGVLVIAGQRGIERQQDTDYQAVHIDERFSGRFRRVVTLPEDADESTVDARFRDGVLQIRIPRKQVAQPRKITIQ